MAILDQSIILCLKVLHFLSLAVHTQFVILCNDHACRIQSFSRIPNLLPKLPQPFLAPVVTVASMQLRFCSTRVREEERSLWRTSSVSCPNRPHPNSAFGYAVKQPNATIDGDDILEFGSVEVIPTQFGRVAEAVFKQFDTMRGQYRTTDVLKQMYLSRCTRTSRTCS